MTASEKSFLSGELPVLAGKRLIGLPIADVQLENPRAVGKGRLLTEPPFANGS
jgi:hypothetical protein